ncbi:hypothetical protein [Pseudomonas typographi]|uniref:Uncharacterized protein n=1 Tax=Pseudomonas typographi TaxID=2715964 RepID=A0ABR7YWC1_9PSED|nr:hypothetical protein [Pseudomonas typographi]MBD1552500.1 hypothetical protein [Pseudomonas typographi]MBD1585590.1 hypothetical protein [Pseudomonas typographi]MBD1597496.1 hypothetical protein [Pseudomonas typographi]
MTKPLDFVQSRLAERINTIATADFDSLALSNYTTTVGYLYALRDFRLLDEQQWQRWLEHARETYCQWSGREEHDDGLALH